MTPSLIILLLLRGVPVPTLIVGALKGVQALVVEGLKLLMHRHPTQRVL